MYSESPAILETIKAAKKILLHLHPSPDLDSIGSALATCEALKLLGKEAVVIAGDSEVPEHFLCLPGASEIKLQTFGQTNLDDFDLFIIQDSASLDRVTSKEEVIFPAHLKTINIDHHFSNPKFAKINLVDSTSPATAYILYQLFIDWELKLNHAIAVNLIMGMYFDTGGFRFRNTTADTLLSCGELVKLAPDYSDYIARVSDFVTVKHLKFLQIALNNIKFLGDNKIAYTTISAEEMKKNNLEKKHGDGFSVNANLLAVKGVVVGFSVFEKEPGITSISSRSNDPETYDVSKLTAKLGGGGHKVAAGAKLKEPLETALPKVLKAFTDTWPEFK